MDSIEKAWKDLSETLTDEQIEHGEISFYCGALYILSEFESISHTKKYLKFESEIANKIALENIDKKLPN